MELQRKHRYITKNVK